MKESKTNEDTSGRRDFLKISGGALLAAGSVGVLESSAQHHKATNPKSVEAIAPGDPLGSATVSFGGWMTGFTPPIDRFTAPLPPPPANHHDLIPNVAKIKTGGYVNFIISGLHIVAIYNNGTTPADIAASIQAGNLAPLGGILPPVVNLATNRVYRGPNPVSFPGDAGPPFVPPIINLDRVEVVQFDTPGTYLVICAVVPHFNEGMFGYVRVLSTRSGEST
jgi:hypothetical protein